MTTENHIVTVGEAIKLLGKFDKDLPLIIATSSEDQHVILSVYDGREIPGDEACVVFIDIGPI